jgi:hypothetical protein
MKKKNTPKKIAQSLTPAHTNKYIIKKYSKTAISNWLHVEFNLSKTTISH